MNLEYKLTKKMRIAVIGLRGFPDVEGGVENHCKNIYLKLSKSNDFEFVVFRRKNFIPKSNDHYPNIIFIDLKHSKKPGLEAFGHTLNAVLHIIFKLKGIDIVHVHGIGSGLLIPLLVLFRFKIVFTYHSENYNHSKWNGPQKWILKLGEYLSLRFSTKIISVSPLFIKDAYRTKSKFIPNGSEFAPNSTYTNQKNIYNILKSSKNIEKYILFVGRITPEKGLEVLLKAFRLIKDTSLSLIVIGSITHKRYFQELNKFTNERVYFLGKKNHSELPNYYKNARMFVLPSYQEGLPIVVLESICFEIPILISDIENNKTFDLPDGCYFQSGNSEDLALRISQLDTDPKTLYDKIKILKNFNWDSIADKTAKVYASLK